MNAIANQVTDAVLKSETITTIEAKPKALRRAIAYNPYSLDSLLGAALGTYLPEFESARLVPYNPFNSIDGLLQYDHIFFVGVEVSQLDFTKLMTATDAIVETTSYRDGYNWVNDKVRKAYGEEAVSGKRLIMHMPIDDFLNQLCARTDNTAIKVMHFLLQELGVTITNAGLVDKDIGIVNLASRMVSQSYPIMPFTIDLDEGVADFETENANKARVLDATNKLRLALASSNPHQEVHDVKFKADVDAYLAHFRQIRYAMTRSISIRGFRMSNSVINSKTVNLPVVQASEMVHSDILHAALQNYNEVVTYEDIGNYRVWRIYAATAVDRRNLASIFKPISTWSEGAVICALTHLDHHQ